MSHSSSISPLHGAGFSVTYLSGLIVFSLFATVVVSRAQDTGPPAYGVRDIELGDGVNAAEFEEYIRQKFAPAWKEPRNGMSMVVLKGDRGERKGKYQIVYHFDSIATRDKFFPSEEEPASDRYRNTMASVAADVVQDLQRFPFDGEVYTDYYPLN